MLKTLLVLLTEGKVTKLRETFKVYHYQTYLVINMWQMLITFGMVKM